MTKSHEALPNGQACTHILQPMHLAASRSTCPVAALRCIAFGMHTVVQGASWHCWHIIGTEKPCRSQV